MSLQLAAKHLAAQGRGPDTTLVHMAPGEVQSLQRLAMAHGGSLTTNPQTGLPEAGFLSKILPMVVGGGLMAMGLPPHLAGLAVGGVETARTGSLGKGLMAGLSAYGGANLGQALASQGAEAAVQGQLAEGELGKKLAEAQTAQQTLANQYIGADFAGEPMSAAEYGFRSQAINQPFMSDYATAQNAAQAAAKGSFTGGVDAMRTGLSDVARGNLGAFTDKLGGGFKAAQTGLMAAAPLLAAQTQTQMPGVQPTPPAQRYRYDVGTATPTPAPDVPAYGNLGQDFGRQRSYFPTAGYVPISAEEAKNIYGFASGGMPVEQMSQANSVGMNTGYPMADIPRGGYATPYQTPISRNVVSDESDTSVDSFTGAPRGMAEGGLNLAGERSRDLPSELESAYARAEKRNDKDTMREIKAETALRNRLRNPMQGMASGGLSDLGGYSDGGRLLRGPGDGVSDSIPAVIGKRQPARLADGEFVVPARIVSELGNGSTEAGARKLYAMMDRVQKERKRTVGKNQVAKNSRADKHLPA